MSEGPRADEAPDAASPQARAAGVTIVEEIDRGWPEERPPDRSEVFEWKIHAASERGTLPQGESASEVR